MSTTPNTTSVDLGLIAAMIPGATPPDNTDIFWLDTTTNPAVKKYYDPGTQTWKPFIQSTDDGSNFKVDLGTQILFVSNTGNDYKAKLGDLSKCFKTIPGAYTFAKTLAPSINKRITIVVYPGTYTDDVTMDADYISIISAVPQDLIYNQYLVNGFTYNAMKRRFVCDATIFVNCKFGAVKGIDTRKIVVKAYLPGSTQPNLTFENMVCNEITNPISAGTVNCTLYDVHAENLFNSDSQTDLSGTFTYSGGVSAFRAGAATYSSGTWKGGIKDSVFNDCYGGDGSFGGSNGYMYNVTMVNCTMKNNCISTIEQSNLKIVKMGNTCVKKAINTSFNYISGGNACFKDFVDVVMQDCDFGADFGRNDGSSDFVSGNFDNVKADYTNGFARGRQFWGKMRRMFIRATAANSVCLNICTPSDAGTDRQPSTIEHSTILNCTTDDSGDTIIGTVAFVSYCKFNMEYTVVNALGSDANSNNIVNEQLCNYTPIDCQGSSLFTLVTSSFTTGAPITIVFNYQMPISRAGSQIEMIDPLGTVTYHNFPGNDGGSGTGTMSIPVTTPVAGAYKFRLRVVCQYDEFNNIAFASTWSSQITANVTNTSRPTAWRAKGDTFFCVIESTSPQPLYGKLEIINSTPYSEWFPDDINPESHQYGHRGDIKVSFYSDMSFTTPVSLVSQNLKIYVKTRASLTSYSYTGTNPYPDYTGYQTTEQIQTYTPSGVSGTSVILDTGVYIDSNSDDYPSGPLSARTLGVNTYTQALWFDTSITGGQTGYKGWTTLEQYYTDNNAATGTTKPNVDSDSDYIAPVLDVAVCPNGAIYTTASFGEKLRVKKIQLTAGGDVQNIAIPTNPFDTSFGSGPFILKRNAGIATTAVVKIDAYSTGPTTPGKVQVTVTYNGGLSQHQEIFKDVETTLGTYIDITNIHFSNY